MAKFCVQAPNVSFPCEAVVIGKCANCGDQAHFWCTFTFGVPVLRSCNKLECFRVMRDMWRIYTQILTNFGQSELVHQFEELEVSS